MGKDKRGYDRHDLRFKLVYDDGESFNAGLVHDLSESGVFLETLTPLAVDTKVRLTSLDLDEAHAFEVDARVARIVENESDDPGVIAGMGLIFLDPDARQHAKLRSLIRRLESEKAAFEGDADPFFGKRIPREGLSRTPSGIWRAGSDDDSEEPTDDLPNPGVRPPSESNG